MLKKIFLSLSIPTSVFFNYPNNNKLNHLVTIILIFRKKNKNYIKQFTVFFQLKSINEKFRFGIINYFYLFSNN